MSYNKLPLKHAQPKGKWITIALIGIYIFIAIFIVVGS